MSLMQLGRRCVSSSHIAAALHSSRRMMASTAQPNSSPADAFAARLQSKTEAELLELLERRNQPANKLPKAAEKLADSGAQAEVRQTPIVLGQSN